MTVLPNNYSGHHKQGHRNTGRPNTGVDSTGKTGAVYHRYPDKNIGGKHIVSPIFYFFTLYMLKSLEICCTSLIIFSAPQTGPYRGSALGPCCGTPVPSPLLYNHATIFTTGQRLWCWPKLKTLPGPLKSRLKVSLVVHLLYFQLRCAFSISRIKQRPPIRDRDQDIRDRDQDDFWF